MRQHLKGKGRPYPAVARQSSTGLTAIPGIQRGEGFRTQFSASSIAIAAFLLKELRQSAGQFHQPRHSEFRSELQRGL